MPRGAEYLVFSYIGFSSKEIYIDRPLINVSLEMEAPTLDEVVVRGYSNSSSSNRFKRKPEAKIVTTTTIENQTTVEFEIEKPYSIKSGENKLSVDINQFSIDAIYEYYAVPKLDKDAFLMARITNWDQYNLLEGEANLYFEGTYVGRSVLNAKALTDTLDISLGRDKSIVIGRKKVEEFSKKRTVGSNKIESRGFEIVAINKKSQPIQLTLFDQIPVSVNSNIQVTPENISNGLLDEKTGELTWKLNLAPQEQAKLNLQYEIKYPKKERVILE